MNQPSPREIPFNYTSADDRQAVVHLLGEEVWDKLERLRGRRVTGRSARLLMRAVGELLIHRRNAYLYAEVVGSPARRKVLWKRMEADFSLVQESAGDEGLVHDVVASCRAAVACSSPVRSAT